ncbi:hypothetical protein Tco_0299025 [Tanacetum coccineum]
MTKSSSTSLNLFLEETNTFDNSSPESETFCFDLEENSSGSTTTRSDYSLPDYEAFYSDDDHIKEKSSGRFTDELAHIISPSEYDHFCFKIEPELGNLTMDVVEDIFPTREPRVHELRDQAYENSLIYKEKTKRIHDAKIKTRCPEFLKPLVLAVFVLRSQELHIPSFILGIRYPNLID